MIKLSVILIAGIALAGCQDAALKTTTDATRDVNENYALGKQLRDRCLATADLDHCTDWNQHKQIAEAGNPLLDYDKGLARWEIHGPY